MRDKSNVSCGARCSPTRVLADPLTPPCLPSRPALYGGFVTAPAVISYERITACRKCVGSGSVVCPACAGRGRLPAGGYQSNNPVAAARIVGSKWTAMQRTMGWRHFRVTQRRKEGKNAAFVLMVATCDETVQLWVNLKNLKDRSLWAAGWLQRTEMRALEEQGAAGPECKVCRGSCAVPCPLCSRAGEVVEL